MVRVNIIKSELARTGQNYKDLAELLDVSTSTLGNKMNNKTEFRVSELLKIAKHFNRTIEFFL